MIKVTLGERKINDLFFTVIIWLLVFQSPLESVHRLFAYIDELVALLGICCCGIILLNGRKLNISANTFSMIGALSAFALIGLLGNLLYQYQKNSAVLIDLFTNLKFFFSIPAGYFLLGNINWDQMHHTANRNARAIILILMCFFLIDRMLNIYPGQIRYGIKSAQLFFSHPTYLAGAMAFLLVLLTVFYKKKNLPYLVMAGFMMAFTLRSKALASAAVFAVLFVFLVLMKKKLKLWHIAVLGISCIVIGWPLINFYYIQLAGTSTRSVMTTLSFTIMQDYFPIGTGFGTFASAAASEHFSKVYEIYNLEYLLRFDSGWRNYLSDTFWPIIIGQTGFLGLLAFLVILFLLLKRCFDIQKLGSNTFCGAVYIFVYLIISSTSEPAFHNAIALPFALVLGILFAKVKERKLLEC